MIGKKSVSQLVSDIKNVLEGEFTSVHVEGEISNLSTSASGHYYFTLSDQDASLSAALFKMDAMRNPLIRSLKNGDKVLCSGEIGVYTKRGTFQLITRRLSKAGTGDLKEELEKLKKKLAEEGLFDLAHKKKIPLWPKKIAIITALQGAALQDFLKIYQRRSLSMDILIVPSLVQGDQAPVSLRQALKKIVQTKSEIDCVVLCRGGGSLEDLWAFNNEDLARDIFNFPIPIISAVGHEVDFSICDYVSDYRAETPSAAAELLTQYQSRFTERFEAVGKRLIFSIKSLPHQWNARIQRAHPRRLANILTQNFGQYQNRLHRCDLGQRWDHFLRISEKQMELDQSIGRLKILLVQQLPPFIVRLEKCRSMLDALGPQSVLNRGYAYLSDDGKQVVNTLKSFSKLKNGVTLNVNFADGQGKVIKL